MSTWEIAALLREAEQVRNDWQLDDAARASALDAIRVQITARGGDASGIGTPSKPKQAASRATRTSKPAAARKKA